MNGSVENNSASAYPRPEGPVSHGWFSLGQGRGIKWTLWRTSVTFQRQEKQGDKWIALEELHVAPKILKEIVWRIPGWLETVDGNGRSKDDGQA